MTKYWEIKATKKKKIKREKNMLKRKYDEIYIKR